MKNTDGNKLNYLSISKPHDKRLIVKKMETIVVTLNTRIGLYTVRTLILTNQIKTIKDFLKSDCRLILNNGVIKLLHSKFGWSYRHNAPYHITERDKKSRESLIKFNRKRKVIQDYINYLESDTFEDIELDYIISDSISDLKFGL